MLMSKTVVKCTQRFLLIGALALPAFASAASISGTVVNKTTGKPSAGDEVLLIDVSADMTEAARTRSKPSDFATLNWPQFGCLIWPHLKR